MLKGSIHSVDIKILIALYTLTASKHIQQNFTEVQRKEEKSTIRVG